MWFLVYHPLYDSIVWVSKQQLEKEYITSNQAVDILGETKTPTENDTKRFCRLAGLDPVLYKAQIPSLQTCNEGNTTNNRKHTMPKPAKAAPEFAKGNSVTFELEGETVTATITKDLKEGNYECKVDDTGAIFQCEANELTLVEDKPEPKVKDKKKEKEESPAKKKGKTEEKNTRSKASSFKDIKATGGGAIPIGKYEAIVFEAEVTDTEKGAVQFVMNNVVVNDDDITGKTQKAFYGVLDEDGNYTEGAGILKGHLILLGFDDDDFDDTDQSTREFMRQLADKINKRQPWVAIKVIEGKNGYTNVRYETLMADQQDKPEIPD